MENWIDEHLDEEYIQIENFNNWKDRHFNEFKEFLDENEFDITEYYNKNTLLDIAEKYIDELEEIQTLEFSTDEILDTYYSKMDISELYKNKKEVV